MFAKRFFYVCAGILCLALAYHFGARSATAQAGLIEAAHVQLVFQNYVTTFVVGRTFYYASLDPTPTASPFPAPVPGSARIVATGISFDGYTALLENGDAYAIVSGGPGSWEFLGNVFGATGASVATWGGVKARYRQGAPTQGK